MKKTLYSLTCVALISPSLSVGETLYESGVYNSPTGAFLSDPDVPSWQASEFTVSDDINISSLLVEGAFYGSDIPLTDNFSVVILSDGGETPGGVFEFSSAVPATRTAGSFAGVQFYLFTLDPLTDIELPAGTYWLSVSNNAATGDPWAWATSAGAGTAAQSTVSPVSGYSSGGTRLFNYALEGSVAVPEQSGLMLGLMGMCVLGRRKRTL